MRVAIRTDAGRHIGVGHVMRCLTLAEALRERGGTVTFLCRAFDGHAMDRIRRAGFPVEAFPVEEAVKPPQTGASPPHAGWLGAAFERDRDLTRDALGRLGGVDLLVVDHYALDARWERAMRDRARRILAVDDLADRPHDADWLLDQTYGRDAEAYRHLVAKTCRLLLGSAYALLRPEFARLRPQALARRRDFAGVREVLISLGGAAGEATVKVLGLAAPVLAEAGCRVRIAGALETETREALERLLKAHSLEGEICGEVDSLAPLMVEADVAIGGAGASSWERCCLGLPALALIMAENQRYGAEKLRSAGAVVDSCTPQAVRAREFARLLRLSGERYRAIAEAAAGLCDGKGARRSLQELNNVEVLC